MGGVWAVVVIKFSFNSPTQHMKGTINQCVVAFAGRIKRCVKGDDGERDSAVGGC